MYYFSHLFVLALLPFFAAAIPQAIPPTSRGIAIPISKRASPNLADPSLFARQALKSIEKIKGGLATFQRNTGQPHPLAGGIKTSSKKRATGSVPLTDDENSLWYGSIEIGTPPKPFTVDFDTGSSDLFVPAAGCETCKGHRMYDPSASSTSKDRGESFELNYGDGSSAKGEQYNDTVIIAGLKATDQALGAAKQYSTGFQLSEFPADGLMGMAFESLSEYEASPVFQTLVAQGAVDSDSATFGFKFASSGSELFLGGTNSKLYKGGFTWVPISVEAYWQAPFDKITVGGPRLGPFRVPVVGKTEAIYDTGTTQIIGDPKGIEKFYSSFLRFGVLPAPAPLHGEGIYSIPCDFKTSISVYVGGKEVKISPETFILGPSIVPGRCIAGAASSTALTGKFWILGDVFLKNAYTAWDVKNKRIGFADLA